MKIESIKNTKHKRQHRSKIKNIKVNDNISSDTILNKIVFSLCLKSGVQESVENLRETYGSNFTVKVDMKNEGGYPKYNEKTVENICNKIKETEEIQDICIEVRGLSFYYDKLEFLQGLSAEVMKIDEDPKMLEEDLYYTKVMMPYGYNRSGLSHYFQTNTLSSVEEYIHDNSVEE